MKLFHGSMYEQPELMPGFLRSGELVQWDQTESNKYLYTTSDREEAIEQGFASAVEKKYRVDRFIAMGKSVHFVIDEKKLPTMTELQALDVFLYEIDYHRDSGWIKNRNKHNGMYTEYKTDQVIEPGLISRCTKIDLKEWLKDRELLITSARAPYLDW